MPISVELALEKLLGHVNMTSCTRLSLAKCYGRVLAEEVISRDFPPFDRSPLDGYAVRMEDISDATVNQPVILEQIDYIQAGTCPTQRVTAGKAARIMTGGRIPDGANAVIRIEDTSIEGNFVVITSSSMADKNICYKGEEFSNGEVVLRKGTVLNEGGLGILAMMGQANPLIYERPQVGILATGSELIPITEPLPASGIYDTNSYMLMSKISAIGGQPVLLGQVRDSTEIIADTLIGNPGLSVYITTGGASVGDYDLMGDVFKKLGIEILFERVAMKPGMPVLAGIWNESLLIALSGNPAACSVSFEVIVKPVLKTIAGMNEWTSCRIKVKLSGDFNKPSGERRFVWARAYIDKGMVFAEPMHHQRNGMLRASLAANVLLDIPANSTAIRAGTEVDALLLNS